MKKYCLFLIAFLFFACDDEPGQFTSVEGIVINYLTQEPISDIPIVIEDSEFLCFDYCNDSIMDTVITDLNGYYYYEFYNDIERSYHATLVMTDSFYSNQSFSIVEGKKNTCDFFIKPYKKLAIECIKKDSLYNRIRIYNRQIESDSTFNLNGNDTIFKTKLVPEYENHITIDLSHKNVEGKYDGYKREYLEFYASKNDTSFIFYY